MLQNVGYVLLGLVKIAGFMFMMFAAMGLIALFCAYVIDPLINRIPPCVRRLLSDTIWLIFVSVVIVIFVSVLYSIGRYS